MGTDKHILKAMDEHREKVGKPHFLLSAENPKYPKHNTLGMNHEQVLHHLKGAGFDAHEVHGHYGAPERSIIVYGVNPKHAEDLHGLASKLGQDSSIYSTGQKHEMRFHHGADQGKKVLGEGTVWHSQKPSDFYTTLPGGSHHFTHNFNFEKSEVIKMPKKDFIKEHKKLLEVLDNPTPKKLKEEHDEQKEEAAKEAGLKHIDKSEDGGRLGLVHYSRQGGLTNIDPKFKGSGVDARTKGRDTEHPHSFFYKEGTEPEKLVTESSAHRYKASIGPKSQPIYDIGHDPHGFVGKVKDENQGAFNMDMLHQKIKEAGYHGFQNSKHPQLSNVVAMYSPLKVESHEPTK